jgi:hypothetical protein
MIKYFISHLNSFFRFIIISLILVSCESSGVKELKLKKDLSEIISRLKNPDNFKHVSVKSGKQRWEGGGGYSDAILIDLTFEKNAPAAGDSLEALAEEKMNVVVNNVSNKSEFSEYVVSFYSATKNGSDSTRIMSYIFNKYSLIDK